MAVTGEGVSVEFGLILGFEWSSAFLFADDGKIYRLKAFDVTLGKSVALFSVSQDFYRSTSDAMDLNGFSVGFEQNMGVGGGIAFGVDTWGIIPVGFNGNNIGNASLESNIGAQYTFGSMTVEEISFQEYLERSLPSIPAGTVSSANMPGQYGNVLQGFETNALDVMGDTNPFRFSSQGQTETGGLSEASKAAYTDKIRAQTEDIDIAVNDYSSYVSNNNSTKTIVTKAWNDDYGGNPLPNDPLVDRGLDRSLDALDASDATINGTIVPNIGDLQKPFLPRYFCLSVNSVQGT